MRKLFCLALAFFVALQPVPAVAWSEAGHHLIAAMAFQLLDEDDQQLLVEILKAHPQFETEFRVPEHVADATQARQWLAGRAGYWPDVARSYKEFNRPNWHYQLGSSLVLGNVSSIKVPTSPGPFPTGANFETQDMHVGQAIEFCRASLGSPSTAARERALAVSWLAHLVADSHQPLHAGSLYTEKLFPEGDRGGNSIPTIQRRNLHALWDGLLGDKLDLSDVRRRMNEITSNSELVSYGEHAVSMENGLVPETWLQESRVYSVKLAYTPEILLPVMTAMESHQNKLEPIRVSERYLKDAGAIAQRRAVEAAYRLKAVWKQGIDASR